MNPVTGAVPPLIRGHGIRFEVDRWTWRRLDAARFDGERRHLLATRGRPWHADPEHGGDTDALETWHLLAGRHQGGGMGLTVTGPGGKLDVSWDVLFQFFLSNFCTIFPQYGPLVSSGNCTI